MSCQHCGDKGLVTLNWSNTSPDYGLCLCSVGLQLRREDNAGKPCVPLWRVWCAREQVDPARVLRLEDVLLEDELRERGWLLGAPPEAREAALLSASKQRPKL